MLASSVCQLLATVALASTSVLAWEKTHNWRYLDGYPLVIQPDRLIQVKGNVSYPGPPSEGPLRLTTTEDQIASCVIDYGAVYTGLDFYNIAASDNTPILRITYSDSLDFVDTGDTMYKTMIQDHNTERQRNYTLDAATTRIESYSSTTFRYVKLEILTVGSGTFRVGALGYTFPRPQPYVAGNFSGEGPGWMQNISKIFNYGAHTLSTTLLQAYSYDKPYRHGGAGIYLDDQASGIFMSFPSISNYTLDINAHIIHKGFGVYTQADALKYAMLFNVASEHSETPNRIQLVYGVSEEAGTVIGEAISPVAITEGDWWKFSFGYYDNTTAIVKINDTEIARFAVPAEIDGRAPTSPGSFGYRTMTGQAVILSNVTAFDKFGKAFLNNDYQGAHQQLQVSAEGSYYGQGTLENVMISAARNRRGMDLQDTVVAAKAVYNSWFTPEFVLGNLHTFGADQNRNGRIATWAWPQTPAKTFWPSDNTPYDFFLGFNYWVEFATAIKDYVMATNDFEAVIFTANEQYPSLFESLSRLNEYMISQASPETGLITIPEGSSYVRDWAGWENSTNPGYLPFEGSPAGTLGKVNILWYQSLRASAFLARELEKNMTLAHEYDELADKVHESVNNVLYDKEKHYYYISTDRKTGIAQDLNAMAILYGVAPIADRQAILDTMNVALIDESKPGKYLAYSYDAYGYPHKAVPYSAYYHAAAAFEVCNTNIGMDIINSVWTPMISEGKFFSKGYWEHLEPNEDTELVASRSTGVITLLSEYVMGVKATSLGHATYDVRPQMGELTRINGTAATSRGQVALDLHKDTDGKMNWTVTPLFYPSDASLYIPTQADFITINGKNLSTAGGATDLPWGVAAITKNTTDYTVKVHLVGTTEFNILV
ncbi:hypothetical protein NCC49_003961 [Naganishia albida]|nr:hypothetical protein NCC49_003961 [Naganishia albida]